MTDDLATEMLQQHGNITLEADIMYINEAHSSEKWKVVTIAKSNIQVVQYHRWGFNQTYMAMEYPTQTLSSISPAEMNMSQL